MPIKIVKEKTNQKTSVSHHPEIIKAVMIGKNGIPGLLQFAKACFKPGQFIEEHKHHTMYEVFYVNYGKIAVKNGAEEFIAEKGDALIVEPETVHGLRFIEDTELIYFNIEVKG